MYIVYFKFEGYTYYLSNPSLSGLNNYTLSRRRAYKFLGRKFAEVAKLDAEDHLRDVTGTVIKAKLKYV